MTVDQMTMQQACESTERVVERITPDQYSLSTPCSEWNVHDVLNHLIGTMGLIEALVRGATPPIAMTPGENPDVDLVGADPVKAYRASAEALLAACTGDALARSLQTPLGERPGAQLAGFTTVDIFIHGWDLAKATKQGAMFDDDLGDEILQFGHQTLTDDMRAPRIGPAIAIPGDAKAIDQLVAFFGRRP
jgi:uncharacterized protein (TIGR03086 family)